MTEAEWFGDVAIGEMTTWVCPARGKTYQVSPRKFRLYAVACARQLPPDFLDHECRRVLDTAEVYAEGAINLRTMSGTASVLTDRAMRARTAAQRIPATRNPTEHCQHCV
jgi:hypothetical protein